MKAYREELTAYRTSAKETFGRISLANFPGNPRPLPLEGLYSPFLPRRLGEAQPAKTPLEAMENHRRVVIRGQSGSGRTTLLRHLALLCARSPDLPVPLMASLKDFETSGTNSLTDYVIERTSAGHERTQKLLSRLIPTGRLVWLLDDFDAASERAPLVEGQIEHLNGSVVVTVLDDIHSQLALSDWPHYEIEELDIDGATKLLQYLCLAYSETSEDAQKLADRLLAHLESSPSLWDEMHLPFNVALFVSVSQGELPSTLAGLFRKGLENLAPPVDKSLQGISAIGWHLMNKGPSTEETLLPLFATSQQKELAPMILSGWQQCGILKSTEGKISCTKQQWLQFSSAIFLSSYWLRGSNDAFKEYVVPHLHHPKWKATLLLAAGLMNSADLALRLRPLLKGISPYEASLKRDLRLATNMLGQAGCSEEEAKLVQRSLIKLVGVPDWRHPFVLALVFFIGLGLTYHYSPPQIWQNLVLVWTGLWGLAFAVPYFPMFRDSLALPARWFKPPADTSPFVIAAYRLGTWAYPILITALTPKETPQSQVLAALRLGRIGREEAVEPLCQTLLDTTNKQEVREAAAHALGEIGSENSIKALSLAYRQRTAEFETRKAAANALAIIDSDDAFAALREGLGHQDHTIRELASGAVGLASRGKQEVETLMRLATDRFPEVRLSTVKSLAELVLPQTIDTLVALLNDHNGDVRQAAAKALGKFGNSAIEPIVQWIPNIEAELETRVAAIQALGCVGTPAIVDRAVACFAYEEHQLRSAAVESLTKTRFPGVVPHLITATGDEWPTVRAPALEGLTTIARAKARPYLVKALHDRARDVRRAAIASLYKLRTPGVAADLLVTLDDKDFEVRRDGARALGQLGDPAATARLVISLDDVNSHVREAAVHALAAIGDDATVEHIVVALADPEPDVRWAAAEAVATFGAKLSLPPLTELLTINDWMIRRNAVAALGAVADSSCLKEVIGALDDSDAEVRCTAVAALSKVGDNSVEETILPLLSDEAETVRAQTAITLGYIGSEKCGSHLATALTDKTVFVRRAAASALGRLRIDAAVGNLIECLDDTSWEVRKAAARALGDLGTRQAIEPLTELLEAADPAMRRHTLDALLLLCTRCDDLEGLDVVARALWWRLTDERAIAVEAFHAMETVAGLMSRK